MFYAALFVIVLIVVSGAIAYIGDIMGRKMGKRRLTLFGLRPRHTAIVITTITGMLIATLTLATLLGVNRQVRWALVKGQAILERNVELSSKNKELRHDKNQLTRELAASQTELREAKVIRVKLDTDISEARKQLDETKRKLLEEQNRLEQARTDLKETKKKLADAQKEVKIAQEIWREVWTGYQTLKGKPIILESGEEVYRTVVIPKPSIPSMRVSVIKALQEAGKVAENAGAAKGKNGRAVVIGSRRIVVPRLKGGFETRTYDESKSIGFIAEALSNSAAPVALQVVVVGNAMEGEQVFVDFRLFNNKLVFSTGRTIAEVTLDASKKQAQLLNDLSQFLLKDVRGAATLAGVIPVANPRDPDKLFGEVGLDRLLEVVEQVKQIGGSVTVKATAQRDAYAAGPLQLEFAIAKS